MKKALYFLFFSCFLVHLCHSCLNFTLHNVIFNVTNFEYVLQWSKDHLPSNVLFSVQYKRYGQTGWSLIHDCQNITEVYCHLTNAIIGDVEDFMEHQYFGRVRASSANCSSAWVMSKRLNPRDDTFLILPKLHFIENVSSVTILVPTPSFAFRSKDNKPMTLEELYKDQSFEYHLHIFNAEKHEIWQKPQKDNRFEVSGLSPNTAYSGSVYIMIGDKRISDIQRFVVKTLPDHSLVKWIASFIVIFVTMLGVVVLYLICKYIQRQSKTPNSLDFKKVTRIQLMTARKEKCSSCTIGFSPSIFPLMDCLDQTKCQHQSGFARQIAYASQFQTCIGNSDSPLLSQASTNLQQNMRMTDSSFHYGGLFENGKMEYRSNHTPSVLNKTSYNSQSELLATIHQPLLDKNSGSFKGLEYNCDTFSSLFSLLNQKPSNELDISPSLGLMSSVVVSDASGFIGQGMYTKTHLPVLSDVIFPGLPYDQVENDALEKSLTEYGSSPYRLQHPEEDSQLAFINGTFICGQPYRLQH